jgi:CheY-like chemotaxis protein
LAVSPTLRILIVDDQQDEVRAFAQLLREESGVEVRVRHPEDVDLTDLETAGLVLVDHQIDEWNERDNSNAPISRRPLDGLALISVLRQYASREQTAPKAFAILTAKIGKLTKPLSPDYRNHAIASANSLEWVFEKSADQLGIQTISLADAVARLPERWSSDKNGHSMDQLMRLLGVDPHLEESSPVARDVAKCLPPIHELSEWSHGLVIIRWLLHRILPYPCFLTDSHYLAARLRLEYAPFSKELQPGTKLWEALETCRYRGILSEFLGTRWWRAGIESFLWTHTERRSFNIDVVRELVCGIAGNRIQSVDCSFPVVCLDEDFAQQSTFVDIDAAVRIRPDDWPSYADDAWATVALAEDSDRIKAIVVEQDREKLKQ